jgi:hypothetical protein
MSPLPNTHSSTRRAGPSLALLVALGACGATYAQQTPIAPPEDPDITVRGKRTSFDVQLARAEDQLFAVFNSINSRDEFDIHCYQEAPFGTRIKQRVCAPKFAEDADAEAALEFHWNGTSPDATSLKGHKQRLLREEMTKLASENPQLRQALLEVAQLQRARDTTGASRLKR